MAPAQVLAVAVESKQLPISIDEERKKLTAPERDARLKFAKAWRSLGDRQRAYLNAMKATNFSKRKALEILAANGREAVAMQTAIRWVRGENFAYVLKALKAEAREAVVDADTLILNADRIREAALAKKPILYRGEPTGFEENQPDVALRATELLMKTQKMLGNDDRPNGAVQGPALIIQVVQRDGDVIDVTPRGVTIDLPAPDGP